MTTEKRDAIITKIMKLMALGNEDRNDNANERENANRQVKRLMAEYSIDFVDLREGKQPGDTFVRMTVDGSEDTLVDYEATLANSIANAFNKFISKKIFSRLSESWYLFPLECRPIKQLSGFVTAR